MKRLSTALLLLLSLSLLSAQETREVTSDPYTGEEILYGKVSIQDFMDPPYADWYNREFESYLPDPTVMDVLDREVLGTWYVTIVLGTWCSDSQREFPRFMKIWEMLGLSEAQLTIIAVNTKKEAPFQLTEGLNIERVPTFIFNQCNMELGRVVESPAESLEKELFRVLYEY
ncbi:MAG: thioredoxin [Bacteroidota bacterium]